MAASLPQYRNVNHSGVPMRRRDVVAGVVAFATCPLAAVGQTSAKSVKLGFLGLGSPAVVGSRVDSLHLGFRSLGYRNGRDYTMEVRAVGAAPAALRQAALELVALNLDVLITHARGTAVLKNATSTIPIVMVSGDAVATGLVDSLSRPGGNITGVSFFSPELMSKRLELLREVLPAIEDAGVLVVGSYPVSATVVQAVEATAKSLDIKLHPILIDNPSELPKAFSFFAEKRIRGVLVQDEPMLIANARHVAELAAQSNILTIGFLEIAGQGGSIAYSIDFDKIYLRAAGYVVKILEGALPRDLPVEQPTSFRLVVNAKSMKALGVDIPPSVLVRADEVIE